MRNILFLMMSTVFVCAGAIHLPGAEPGAAPATPATGTGLTNSSVLTWDADVSNGRNTGQGYDFRKGMLEAGLSVGGGVGSTIFGSSEAHDLVLGRVYIGRVMTGVIGQDDWYRGNVELMGEMFGGKEVHPGSGYVIGVTPALRYNFDTGTRWAPFFDAGFGATATDIGHPDLDGTFQFNIQAGPGIRWLVSKNTALTLQYRFIHLSDDGMTKPNRGVNTSVIYVGASWFF